MVYPQCGSTWSLLCNSAVDPSGDANIIVIVSIRRNEGKIGIKKKSEKRRGRRIVRGRRELK